MARKFKFTAFISYSHADAKAVSQLHRALEGYRLPKHLVGQKTSLGVIPKKMPPFFRDRDDLSAATNLTASVKKALRNSQFLIVICSPDGAKSRWVDKEIREFEKIHGRENILCFIVGSGDAGAKGVKAIDCFPPRILEMKASGDYEPIAADARPGGDGKRLAKLKLIAGLLGIELDQLIQRDAQRRQQRQAVVMAFSLLGVIVLSVLLGFAIEARKEAETSRRIAEDRQFQAESLVEFMLGDLRENLAPIGSLEMMDTIAVQALGYYSSLDPETMTTEALSRRSEVLRMLGDVQKQRGNSEQAIAAFREAFLTTEELLARDPQNPERIFDHSQSVFYLAEMDLRQGALEEAEKKFRLYADFADQMAGLEPDNQDYVIEVGYAHGNLGALYANQGRFEPAETEFDIALDIFKDLAEKNPNSEFLAYELAQSYAWLGDAQIALGKIRMAKNQREKEQEIYQTLLEKTPQNINWRKALVVTNRTLGAINAYLGEMGTARNDFEKGREIAEGLLAFDPENTGTMENLASLIYDEIEFLGPLLTPKDKKPLAQKAESLTQNLWQKDPGVSDWVVLRARTLLNEAETLFGQGNPEKAGEIAAEANQLLFRLLEEDRNNFNLWSPLGKSAMVLYESHQFLGTREKGLAALRAFIEVAENNQNRMNLRAQDFLARAWLRAGLEEKAQQKRDFLAKTGYTIPDFQIFWKEVGGET